MSGSQFWDFSLAVYGQPGVPGACLALQDEQGADVNLLLCLLWLGTRGRRLEAKDIAALETPLASWKAEVVLPLRRARRALKAPPPAIETSPAAALRQQVKGAELEAERLQQEALAAICLAMPPGSAADPGASLLSANVEAYARHLGTDFPGAATAILISAAARQM